MAKYKIIETTEKPYIYVTRKSSMDPAEIKKAMGQAYGDVMGFMLTHGIHPAAAALSVHNTYDPEQVELCAADFSYVGKLP